MYAFRVMKKGKGFHWAVVKDNEIIQVGKAKAVLLAEKEAMECIQQLIEKDIGKLVNEIKTRADKVKALRAQFRIFHKGQRRIDATIRSAR